MASPAPSRVVHLATAPPTNTVQSLASGTQTSSPYGPKAAVARQLHATVPPHLADRTRTTVEDLMHDDSSRVTRPGSRGLAGLPSSNPRQHESVGVLAIPQKRHIEEPFHKVTNPTDKIQEANMRYYNGTYNKTMHKDVHAKVRLDSTGVRSTLDPAAPPPPDRMVIPEVPVPRKGATAGGYSRRQADVVGDILVGAGDRLAPHTTSDFPAPKSPGRPETVLTYYGTGVRDTINGDRRPSEPFESRYGYGIYGAHTERQSSLGGAPGRRHFSARTQRSDGVTQSLLAGAEAAAGSHGGSDTPRSYVSGGDREPITSYSERVLTGGSKGGKKQLTYQRHLRSSGAVSGGYDPTASAPFATGSSAPFATHYAQTYSGSREGGPRAHTPPKRQLAPVYGGINDPHRMTQIY